MFSRTDTLFIPDMNKTKYMTENRAAFILSFGLYRFDLGDGKKIIKSGYRGADIYWIVQHGSFLGLRRFSTHVYLPGLIRLRNDRTDYHAPPKSFWPFEELPEIYTFELTFAEDEIRENFASKGSPITTMMAKFVENISNLGDGDDETIPKLPMFEHYPTFPSYAWTKAAKRFYDITYRPAETARWNRENPGKTKPVTMFDSIPS